VKFKRHFVFMVTATHCELVHIKMARNNRKELFR
jgi:hypothetical protein